MVLYIYLFDSKTAGHCDNILQILMQPYSWSKNKLLSLFKLTTKEVSDSDEAPCYERYVILAFFVPLLLILIMFTAPVSLISFLCWVPLQRYRHPFCYTCQNTSREVHLWKEKEAQNRIVRIASLNTNLLPEYQSRKVNLCDTNQRAQYIINAIVQSQVGTNHPIGRASNRKKVSLYQKTLENEDIILTQSRIIERNTSFSFAIDNFDGQVENSTYHVSQDFLPHTDILCLQGLFCSRIEKNISGLLHQGYPHTVGDAAVYSWHCKEGSGLVTASRYPVMDAFFHSFTNAVEKDANRSKGVLFTKLEIGESSEGKRFVGFVTNTHLQDGLGHSSIRDYQLNELKQRHNEFRESTTAEREIVVFDVLSGCLGFDNISYVDKENWLNDIFDVFEDDARLTPGKDKSGVIGTELILSRIHEPDIASAEGLRIILEDPATRECYIQSGIEDDKHIRDEELGEGSSSQGQRRLNYIMMNKSDSDSAYETVLTDFTYITRLTGLVTHLPISYGFVLQPSKQ